MGEILGIGCTHTGVTGPIERMADIYLRQNLKSDLTPPHLKDPKNWPDQMRSSTPSASWTWTAAGSTTE